MTNDAAVLDAAFETVESQQQHALGGFYPAETLERSREEDDISARQAADELIKKRNAQPTDEDQIELKSPDGSRLDPKASATQSDARELAKHLTDYRTDRNALAAELQAAENPATEESPEQVAQAQQQAAEEAAARALHLEQTAQAAIEQARQAQTAYEQATRLTTNQAANLQNAEFNDIKSFEDLAKLAREDPERHARLMQLGQHYQNAAVEAQRVEGQRAHEAQQQWQHYAIAEDEAFSRAHPELKNPETKQRLQNQVLEYLGEQGLSRAQIEHMWNSEAWFRGARTQEILYQAVQWQAAQKRAKTIQAKAKPVPPVQRPGVSRGWGGRHDEDLRILSGNLDQHGRVMDAARLLIQRRAAARG